MRKRGGRIGPLQTISTSVASGFWDLTTQQQQRGSGAWTGSLPVTSGLRAWFDASNSGSITSSAGLVSQWNDVSGNGRHLTSASAGRPSTGTNTQNGLNVLTFTNGNYLSNYPVQMTMPAFTVITALKLANTSDRMQPVGLGNSLGPGCCGGFLQLDFNTYQTAGTRYGMYTSNSSWDTSLTLTTAWTVVTWSSSAISGQSIASTTTYRVNQSAGVITAASVNESNWGDITVNRGFIIGGSASDLTGGNFVGQMAETIFYGAALTLSDIILVENYLRTKWSI